jgi:hypothetical protein
MGTASVIGIDVGGARKGFHAVALRAGATAGQLATTDAEVLAHWCRAVIGAQLIAIDAPCRWSADGRARPCERALNAAGIRCFSSPSRQAAISHPSNYYGWMLQGEALYRQLEVSHPLLAALPPTSAASAPNCCGRPASTRPPSPASTSSMPPSAPLRPTSWPAAVLAGPMARRARG